MMGIGINVFNISMTWHEYHVVFFVYMDGE